MILNKKSLAVIVIIIPVIFYLGLCTFYLNTPSFYDHIEPTIVMESALLSQGKPIYTDINDANRISLVYGPSTYFVNAIMLEVIPNQIIAGKISGISLTLCGLLLLFFFFKRNYSFLTSLLCISYCIVMFIPFGHLSFWNRPESILIFSCAVACASLMIKNNNACLILFSLGISICLNARITAALYILPLIIIFYYNKGLKKTIYAILLVILFVFVPFILFSSFNLLNYLMWSRLAAVHSYSLHQFFRSISYSFIFLIPLIVGFTLTKRSKISSQNIIILNQKLILFCLVGALIITSLVASKEGAGSHHLMPFAVIIMFFLAAYLNELIHKKKNISSVSFIICYALISFWITAILYQSITGPQKRFIEFMINDYGDEVRDELLFLKTKYQKYSICMGYSGDNYEAYKSTFFRPLLLEKTSDYFLDAPALMDMAEANIKIPPATLNKISSHYYDIFLIPNSGKPFTEKSSYSSKKLIFGKSFPLVFKKNYVITDSKKYFLVYKSRSIIK